ncbi:hypothetical protein [Pseudoalteromonas piscicida]|uniref:hypothetical protein n=1 Tax=Pseudoalteromonas piscicida TaxID=43662 RepID=UPI0011083755|nr:hypothetical protein [Pseudoalteromonas piscicida]TMN38979.1 hypothetical protein CWB95_13385 [Pseudoalteromonas piscicida]TMN42267.1 hypothetical protein CWB94_05150 [Pseudoalteromonas piscicida]TMN53811.1 hypothetical protein CWB91_09330 [Pseudoalteromonas piscicida]
MLIKRCSLGSSECALFIVAQLLPRLLGGKSSVATKTHSEEQKLNSKGKQALAHTVANFIVFRNIT